jgi:transcriptional regulator with XRE-family HTH domain
MIAAGPMLREAREATGLTQRQLADRLGTTQSAVARLEAPGANPRLSTLSRAIAATGHRLEASISRGGNVDETMIASTLRRSPAERLEQHRRAYAGVAGMVRAARRGS